MAGILRGGTREDPEGYANLGFLITPQGMAYEGAINGLEVEGGLTEIYPPALGVREKDAAKEAER